MNSMKRQKGMTLKDETPDQRVPQEKSGEIRPEEMKRLNQSENDAQ